MPDHIGRNGTNLNVHFHSGLLQLAFSRSSLLAVNFNLLLRAMLLPFRIIKSTIPPNRDHPFYSLQKSMQPRVGVANGLSRSLPPLRERGCNLCWKTDIPILVPEVFFPFSSAELRKPVAAVETSKSFSRHVFEASRLSDWKKEIVPG